MATLEHTRALMAELAAQIGLPSLPQDPTGGYHLTVGDETDVFVYGGDDVFILVVLPLAPLPRQPEYALVSYLLRQNLFDSEFAPFQVAVDEEGTLVLWGRLRIADLDGTRFARVIDNLADRAAELRLEIRKSEQVEGA